MSKGTQQDSESGDEVVLVLEDPASSQGSVDEEYSVVPNSGSSQGNNCSDGESSSSSREIGSQSQGKNSKDLENASPSQHNSQSQEGDDENNNNEQADPTLEEFVGGGGPSGDANSSFSGSGSQPNSQPFLDSDLEFMPNSQSSIFSTGSIGYGSSYNPSLPSRSPDPLRDIGNTTNPQFLDGFSEASFFSLTCSQEDAINNSQRSVSPDGPSSL